MTQSALVLEDASKILRRRRRFWVVAGIFHGLWQTGFPLLVREVPPLFTSSHKTLAPGFVYFQELLMNCLMLAATCGFLCMALEQVNSPKASARRWVEGFFAGPILLAPAALVSVLSTGAYFLVANSFEVRFFGFALAQMLVWMLMGPLVFPWALALAARKGAFRAPGEGLRFLGRNPAAVLGLSVRTAIVCGLSYLTFGLAAMALLPKLDLAWARLWELDQREAP